MYKNFLVGKEQLSETHGIDQSTYEALEVIFCGHCRNLIVQQCDFETNECETFKMLLDQRLQEKE